LGLSGVVLGHFRLLSRCGRSIPCTRSPNTPSPSCFYPPKSVPLSLNAYSATQESDLSGIKLVSLLMMAFSLRSKGTHGREEPAAWPGLAIHDQALLYISTKPSSMNPLPPYLAPDRQFYLDAI